MTRFEQGIILFLLILFSVPVKAIRIEGFQPAWAGYSLEFVTWKDPVSQHEIPVFNLQIDTKGNFSTEVQITETTYCFVDFGIYRGKLLLVPDQNMKIALPPFREKSFEESKNPYFEPVEIWLRTLADNALTNLVSRFDTKFNLLTEKYFSQLYYQNHKNYIDTIRLSLDKQFSQIKNPDFILHSQLRMKSLEADLTRSGREKIAGKLPLSTSSDWNQPAFVEFVNQLFINNLSVESKTPAGKSLKQWVVQKSLTDLRKWTEAYTDTGSPLSDLILLKMLQDAFYSGEFSKPAILQMLRSDYFARNPQPKIRTTSQEVITKLSFLLPGTFAPVICLPILNGTEYCSDSGKSPFTYVLFADLEIPVCREQVKYLKTISEKTGPNLQILLVLLPSPKIDIADFIATNKIPGVVVCDSISKTTGKKYQVRSYPSAFLINKEHKVILAPAKTPLDGFEFQFAAFKK